MFWVRNEENSFPIHTLFWRPELGILLGRYREINMVFLAKLINLCHAEDFYVLHSSPVSILLTSSITEVSMYFQSERKSVDPDQMASPEAS